VRGKGEGSKKRETSTKVTRVMRSSGSKTIEERGEKEDAKKKKKQKRASSTERSDD